MGDLIVMARSHALPSREIVAGRNAEILFFTGVRYYRMEEVPVASLPVKRRRTPEQRIAAKVRREERRLNASA